MAAQLRPRGVAKALTLAEEQGERRALQRALSLVAKFEERLQRAETEKDLAAAGLGGARKRGGGGGKPEHEQEARLKTVSARKVPRKAAKKIIDAVVARMQGALKRYHLRKRKRGVFSLRATRKEFISLLAGHVAIKEHTNGKLFAKVTAPGKSAILDKLGDIFGVPNKGPDRHWFARRFYGSDHKRQRDCAFLDFDLSCSKKSHMLFGLKTDRVTQVTRAGRRITTRVEKMFVKMPRGVAPVRPLKKHRTEAKAHARAANSVQQA